jgi:hypothetical protein
MLVRLRLTLFKLPCSIIPIARFLQHVFHLSIPKLCTCVHLTYMP